MKIAVSGKGGSGKTLFVASLATILSQKNKVYAIDADPDGNLGITLGFTQQELKTLKPISELKDIIQERTQTNQYSGFYILNPEVSDIPESYSLKRENLYLLVLGTIKKANSGCYCPENAFLKSLLAHLILERNEIVIIDLPAGIEVLTRGTAKNIDTMFILTEPTLKSIQTTERILGLCDELQLKNAIVVANKIVSDSDLNFIREKLKMEIKNYISFDESLVKFEQGLLNLNNTTFFKQTETILSHQ